MTADETLSDPQAVTDSVGVPLANAVRVADRLEQRLPDDDSDADEQCDDECDALDEGDKEGDPELLLETSVVKLADTLREASAVALGECETVADTDAAFDVDGERDPLVLGESEVVTEGLLLKHPERDGEPLNDEL